MGFYGYIWDIYIWTIIWVIKWGIYNVNYYRCPNRPCRRKYSLRPGTFFSNSGLPIYQQLALIVCWWNDLGINQTAQMVGVSPNTASRFFNEIRAKVVAWNIDNITYFDVNGGEFEVDEFLIKGVKDGWHECCWVAGIIERYTGRYVHLLVHFLFILIFNIIYRVFYHVVERRFKWRLIPHIWQLVPDGSVIYSDELASYKCLTRFGYTHKTVNHSKGEYCREEDDDDDNEFYVHINTTEAHNRVLKGRFKNVSLRTKERIKQEVEVYNWRRQVLHKRNIFEPFKC